jgi:hypothetical protein
VSQSITPPPSQSPPEPGLRAVEFLCERLGELGLPIGPDTARDILRAVLAIETPRMEAHVRDALQTSIETIRVAAQSASGVLSSITPVPTRRPRPVAEPVLDPPPPRRGPPAAPAATPPASPRSAQPRRSAPQRAPKADPGDDADKRPVFRRPRGR